MPELRKTNRVNRHTHVAYLKEDGTGITSENNKHRHKLTLEVVKEEIVDPNTNQVLSPKETRWNMEEVDDHTHELEQLTRKMKRIKMTDEEKVERVHRLFKASLELERESRNKSNESQDFVGGKQWTDDQVDALKAQERAFIVYNKMRSRVNLMSGQQRQTRTDIRYLPFESGDQFAADMFTSVVKNINEQNIFEQEESLAFENMLIWGQSNFQYGVRRDKNIEGDIFINMYPGRDVYRGPHDRIDGSDLDYQIKTKMISFAEFEKREPEKSKEFFSLLQHAEDSAVERPSENLNNTYDIKNRKLIKILDEIVVLDLERKEVRMFELTEKEYKKVPVIVNIRDDFRLNGEGLDKRDIASVKTIPGFQVFQIDKFNMKTIAVAGEVFLKEFRPKIISDDFDTLPLYAYKDSPGWTSWIDIAKDPNREINKRRSMLVDILNKANAYGWFVDRGMFHNTAQLDDFVENSSVPGNVTTLKDATNRRPIERQGTKFPVELVNMIALDDRMLDNLLNVPPELLGQPGKAESGIGILENKRQGLLGNDFLFDNLSMTKRRLFRNIAILVQKIYTPQRIARLLRNQNRREEIELDGQGVSKMPDDVLIQRIQSVLDNTDVTKLDVVVSESQWSPTIRRANFIEWANLAGQGVPVPPQMLVSLSDLPNKDEVLRQIEAEQKARAEADKAKSDAQVQSARIAADSRVAASGGGGGGVQ